MRTKASDADRDRTVSHLDAAFVDGQLTSDEREERVDAALRARTWGELAQLTADLQTAPVAEPGPDLTGRPTSRLGTRPTSRLGTAQRVALGVAVAAAALLVVRLQLPDSSSTQTAVTEASTSDAAPGSQDPASEPAAEPWELSLESLREFREAYRTKFATQEFYKLWITDSRIYAEVPARSSKPRWDGWTWTGEWSENSTAQQADAELGSMAGVNFSRLLDNIALAERDLGVEEARFSQAFLNTYDGTTGVMIRVENVYDESASLFTAPDGTITQRSPAA